MCKQEGEDSEKEVLKRRKTKIKIFFQTSIIKNRYKTALVRRRKGIVKYQNITIKIIK